jgi:hypothetical protein
MQAMAAVQAKVLRLNSTAISDVTNGKIVNLVSNDVRRFDDAGEIKQRKTRHVASPHPLISHRQHFWTAHKPI